MKKKLLAALFALVLFNACHKPMPLSPQTEVHTKPATGDEFISYTIFKGTQYCDKNKFFPLQTTSLCYQIIFDSSAMYTTRNRDNQYDINKLFGFSDNKCLHHEYSARFGWRWSDEAIRLFAYVYNQGVRSVHELGTAEPGKQIECRITISGNAYLFFVNGKQTSMPRAATTDQAEGYLLYPYFGGDETAPQDITIRMKEIKNPIPNQH